VGSGNPELADAFALVLMLSVLLLLMSGARQRVASVVIAKQPTTSLFAHRSAHLRTAHHAADARRTGLYVHLRTWPDPRLDRCGFVRAATLANVFAVVRDYYRSQEFFKPTMVNSALLSEAATRNASAYSMFERCSSSPNCSIVNIAFNPSSRMHDAGIPSRRAPTEREAEPRHNL
jgi:hypothetical protein